MSYVWNYPTKKTNLHSNLSIFLNIQVRSNIQRVALYTKGAVQKRLAAYLILMKNPEASDLEVVRKILTQEQNVQVKSFVASHVYNIIHSRDPEMKEYVTQFVSFLYTVCKTHQLLSTIYFALYLLQHYKY